VATSMTTARRLKFCAEFSPQQTELSDAALSSKGRIRRNFLPHVIPDTSRQRYPTHFSPLDIVVNGTEVMPLRHSSDPPPTMEWDGMEKTVKPHAQSALWAHSRSLGPAAWLVFRMSYDYFAAGRAGAWDTAVRLSLSGASRAADLAQPVILVARGYVSCAIKGFVA
jgi:hypothetical protein